MLQKLHFEARVLQRNGADYNTGVSKQYTNLLANRYRASEYNTINPDYYMYNIIFHIYIYNNRGNILLIMIIYIYPLAKANGTLVQCPAQVP